MNKSVIITETTLFCYICKPRDIAELHRSLNCWVENHPICMMSCVGFEVYKFSPSATIFSEPPLRVSKNFWSPPSISSSPPACHIKWTFPYHICKAWYSGSYTMMAKPITALELHYPMIHFLIILISWKIMGRESYAFDI